MATVTRSRQKLPLLILGLFLAILANALGAARARELTFEERVKYQEAIERVYYSHQIDARLSFEEAVPRAVLEKKVRTYLKQSVALAEIWHTPITGKSLHAEAERIARSTRFPGRLQELYAALGHDTFLIDECLARPVLVDRLTRSFFATDARIHSTARAEAEELRNRVARNGADLRAEDARRAVVDLVRTDPAETGRVPPSRLFEPGKPARLEATPEAFRQWRSRAPEKIGEVGPLIEEREAFLFRIVIEEGSRSVRLATYTVRKKSWDDWWKIVQRDLKDDEVKALASESNAIPSVLQTPEPVSKSAGGMATTEAMAEEPLGPDCLQDTWDNGSLDDFPDPRSNHTAIWTGSLMVLWGGDGFFGGLRDSGWRYDPLIDLWTPVSVVNAPEPRAQHTAIWTGTRMIVWGGYGDSGALNTGGQYDPATDTWTPTSIAGAPAPRRFHTAIWTGSEMIVWGGTGSGPRYTTGGRYNPANDTWTATAPRSPGCIDHTAVWTGSLMIIWGGDDGGDVFGLNAAGRGAIYNPSTDIWIETSKQGAPLARSDHAAVWSGSRMLIWGGKLLANSSWTRTGGLYDPLTNTWSPTSTSGAPASGDYPAVWSGSELIVSTGGRYDPSADAWNPISTLNAPTSVGGTGVWTGGLMVVWGGKSGNDSVNVGGRYDRASDTWTPTATSPAPSARLDHSAVWTGNLMVIWGGWSYLLNPGSTGGRYDPVLETWSPTSISGAPSPRVGPTALWTGNLMLLWGSKSGFLNSGGRYDPIADTWTPISTTGPTPRAGSTVVWTGTRMVVWGGYDNQVGLTNTGGIYNPTNDSWTSTSTTGAPSARWDHTAVWTGSRMVVWGGDTSIAFPSQYTNTGGRYNPQNNTWASLSTQGAPAGRIDHTAIWTGSRMIVWGGTTDSALFYTGGLYNPQSNSWSPMTTTNAPRARKQHRAIWTGTQMVVWGGIGNFIVYPPGLNFRSDRGTGGRYDPATDSWRPTSLMDAPVSRYGHSAVWTGTQMIVWGGLDEGYMNSGGRLRFDLLPDADTDQDGFTVCGTDCDDGDATIHPGATEVCNGRDDNCAGGIDETFDLDADGWPSCDGDCDDADPARNPGMPEICNGNEDDCDGYVDEGFPDNDRDGYTYCIDCDDGNADTNAGAQEKCDGRDNDCDGTADEGGNALCGGSGCFIAVCNGFSGCQTTGTMPAGSPCNDQNACTQTDTCNSFGSCIGSNPVTCPAPNDCQNPGSCTNTITGECTWTFKPNGTSCSDGNGCTMGETCQLGNCQGGAPKDADSDARVDAACGGNDCNDANATVWLSPVEVTNLAVAMASPADMSWDSQAPLVGPETAYDLVSLTLTAGGFSGASSTCLQSSAATTFTDARPDPPEGAGFLYIVRGRNSCGIGTYGTVQRDSEIGPCP
jgi:N-acetylneuraminic acid mutarotase